MLKLRLFTEKDYPTVSEWWKAHDWPPVRLEALGEIGLIALNDTLPIAAAWLHCMTRYWGLIEWVIVNPEAGMKDRLLAVELILDRLKVEGKALGVKVFFASIKSPGLIRVYQKHGFEISDRGMTNLTCKVGD